MASTVAPRPLDNGLGALIATMAAAAGAAIAVESGAIANSVAAEAGRFGAVVALTLVLQLFSIRVYGRGSVSVSAIGILSAVFLLNAAAAIAVAVLAALAQWIRSRGQAHKAIFDCANYALAAGAAALAYQVLVDESRFVAALLAGCIYAGLNNGLLCLAMSFAEQTPWGRLWLERFHWARYHFLLFGPLALAAAIAYEQIGVVGLVAFALPPALMILSVRQYLERTAAAVEEIRDANARLRRAHRDTIAALSRSMEAKDLYTGGHTERVATVAVALAERLGYDGEQLETIEIGALLHDVGKIGIPERILRKQGPLTADEWEEIRRHPVVSDYILSDLDLDPIVRQCARWSHERIDGHGYPDGLRGGEIPLAARIVFVADAFDALTSDRPYRAGRSVINALAEIEDNAGTQFCPQVVAALRGIWQMNPKLLAVEQPPQLDAA
jgi:hypothetical protein